MLDGPDKVAPTLGDICAEFERLSERAMLYPYRRLDPFISCFLRRAVEELQKRFMPGLDKEPDVEHAAVIAKIANRWLSENRSPEALAFALKGLSLQPHNPELYLLAAYACVDLCAEEDALRLANHAKWINPSSKEAKSMIALIERHQEDWRKKTASDIATLSMPTGLSPTWVESPRTVIKFDLDPSPIAVKQTIQAKDSSHTPPGARTSVSETGFLDIAKRIMATLRERFLISKARGSE